MCIGVNVCGPRLLRFAVPKMDTKGNILNVARNLRNHEQFSSVLLISDLTQWQCKAVFEICVNRRKDKRLVKTLS